MYYKLLLTTYLKAHKPAEGFCGWQGRVCVSECECMCVGSTSNVDLLPRGCVLSVS